MDSTKVLTLLENLDDEIDDLEEAMAPLLQNTLTDIASKHPLLDKAKLYIFITYAIESMLFSYLQLNGVKAREHPVFLEITRVKQYFDKIKLAEHVPEERNLTLDKGAAGRFIKAGLAGNDKFDLIRAEQKAKELARTHIRFNESQNVDRNRQPESDVKESCADSGNKPTTLNGSDVTASIRKIAEESAKEMKAENNHDKRLGQEILTPKPSKKLKNRQSNDLKGLGENSKGKNGKNKKKRKNKKHMMKVKEMVCGS